MVEKVFELDSDRKLAESVMSLSEIEGIAKNASIMEKGNNIGYIQLGGWELRENDYYFSKDGRPVGYQITSAESLYCDIKKGDDRYVLYISEDGKFLSNQADEPLLTTDSLDREELKGYLVNLIEDVKKDVYRYYGVKPKKEIVKKEVKNIIVETSKNSNSNVRK